MTKNIEVVDEHGVSYGVTYPKRAKGLVKNGRARYENDEKIVLARPPEHLITEDIKMSDKTNNLETARPPEFTPNEVTPNLEPPKDFKNITPPPPATEGKFDYALAQKYYEIFIGGLVPLGPDSDSDAEDTRPEQARLMFEKLFRLEPDPSPFTNGANNAKLQAFRLAVKSAEAMDMGEPNVPFLMLVNTFYELFGRE
jgi:hypothetical protein